MRRGVVLAALSLALVALAFAATSLATVAPTPATYTRNVTSQDLAKAGSAAPYGIWTLRIKTKGLSLAAKGQGLVPERAAWTASTVVISDTPGAISIFCGSTVRGTYRWAVKGSTVTFKLVKDACKDRVGVVVGTWKHST
jgi:hypothetical protein